MERSSSFARRGHKQKTEKWKDPGLLDGLLIQNLVMHYQICKKITWREPDVTEFESRWVQDGIGIFYDADCKSDWWVPVIATLFFLWFVSLVVLGTPGPSSMCCTVSEDILRDTRTQWLCLSNSLCSSLFVIDVIAHCHQQCTSTHPSNNASLLRLKRLRGVMTPSLTLVRPKWTFLSVSLSSQQTTKFSMKTKSRDCGTYMQWSCKFWWCNGFTVVHAKRNLPKTSREVSEDSSVQKENPRSRFAVAALELREACEELNWSRERSTPRRSHTNRSAERVARRKTEGLHEATECHGYPPKCARISSRWPDTLRTPDQFTTWRTYFSNLISSKNNRVHQVWYWRFSCKVHP